MAEIIEGASAAARFLGINRDTVHRHIKKDSFPTPVSTITVGENADRIIRAWRKGDLEKWKEKRDQVRKGWEIGRRREKNSKK